MFQPFRQLGETQEAIAAAVGVDRTTITKWIGEKSADAEFAQPPASRSGSRPG